MILKQTQLVIIFYKNETIVHVLTGFRLINFISMYLLCIYVKKFNTITINLINYMIWYVIFYKKNIFNKLIFVKQVASIN